MAERRQPNPMWIFHSVVNPVVSCPPLTQVYYLGNINTSNHGFIKTVYHITQLSWWTVYLKRLKKQQRCTWKDWHRPPGQCRLQGGKSILPGSILTFRDVIDVMMRCWTMLEKQVR
jgi:hypothetical protein